MPFDSGGNHSLPDGTIVNTGDKILPSQHNPAMQDISASLSSVLVRDGRAGMVGNLSMGGFKTVNMGDGTDPTDGATVGQLGTAFGEQVGAATSKATPVDADYLPVYDSAAANALRKLTWANVKATLKTYLDTLYAPAARTVTGGGLATGGGDLTANLTITVTEASQAQAQAGTASDVVLTPRRFVDAFKSVIYSGTSATTTDLPVGGYITMVGPSGGIARNAAVAPCLRTSNSIDYIHSAAGDAGAPLSGTWRTRGRMYDNSYLVQRVA